MGEAMLSAILARHLSLPQDILISDIDPNRRQHIRQKYQVGVTGDNRLAIHQAEVVVLAIKPQNLGEVMLELNGQLGATQLVLSIVAGARLDSLLRGLSHHRLVRAMPNTPARIGEGVTVWTATPQVGPEQKRWASSILGAMGKEIYVDDEQLIDMATAVSGSGPAYLFLFVEALVDAAVGIGLPRKLAQELVLQTVLGSAHLLEKSGQPPGELRRMVTSPGGTTEQALLRLDRGGFAHLLAEAIKAAHDKAKSLGKG